MNFVDPRVKNTIFGGYSASDYVKQYAQSVSEGMRAVKPEAIDQAFSMLANAANTNRTIFTAGNGGSSTIAEHFCCDWIKGTYCPPRKAVKAVCLSTQSALVTALANDFAYDQIFSKQLEMNASTGDTVVLISSSGNSPNIIQAAQYARKSGIRVIGLSGFLGGQLADLSDVSLHVPVQNYGVVEDCHQILVQSLAQFLFKTWTEKSH